MSFVHPQLKKKNLNEPLDFAGAIEEENKLKQIKPKDLESPYNGNWFSKNVIIPRQSHENLLKFDPKPVSSVMLPKLDRETRLMNPKMKINWAENKILDPKKKSNEERFQPEFFYAGGDASVYGVTDKDKTKQLAGGGSVGPAVSKKDYSATDLEQIEIDRDARAHVRQLHMDRSKNVYEANGDREANDLTERKELNKERRNIAKTYAGNVKEQTKRHFDKKDNPNKASEHVVSNMVKSAVKNARVNESKRQITAKEAKEDKETKSKYKTVVNDVLEEVKQMKREKSQRKITKPDVKQTVASSTKAGPSTAFEGGSSAEQHLGRISNELITKAKEIINADNSLSVKTKETLIKHYSNYQAASKFVKANAKEFYDAHFAKKTEAKSGKGKGKAK